MGGKKGNRTKGNTRPSSSGRSAEILSASGVSGFVGFAGLSTDIPGFIGLGTSDDVESTVDPDFRMVMKKITKRDSVTRIKALQELSELCQNKCVSAVKGALPYWPRFFLKLAVDHDRRVRESTHQANQQLVMKVKKDLAPYLKSMMGTWVVSMCDPYAPASSAAQEAFQLAFPASKQPEALEFCKDDIFHFIMDILFQQTAKTLSDASVSSPEEMDSKYIRLLASSLKALKFLVTTVTDLKNEKTVQYICNILDDNKFWKYAKHKETEIQIAWYLFVSSLCQHMPEITSKYIAKLAPLTLGHIDETQPIVASLIWESTLHLLVTVEDCWQHVNVQKAVFPQLWKLLRSGGNGNAHCIFKNLLPFLSKIPSSLCEPKYKFFSEFFDNFKQGLLNDKIQNSGSELKAVIQAYLECLRFVLLQNLHPVEEETTTRTELVENYLLPLAEITILDLNCNVQKPFFSELGIFLRALENQMLQEKNPELSDVLQNILNTFWGTVFEIYNKILIDEDDTNLQLKLKRFSAFCQQLHSRGNVVKTKRVSFAKELEKEELESSSSSLVIEPHLTNLVQNTHRLCALVLRKIKSSPHVLHLELFSDVVNSVPSKDLFHGLFQEYFGSETEDDGEVKKFISEVLIYWLENRDSLFGTANDTTATILGIMLHACACIPQCEAFAILNDQCNKQDFFVLEKLVLKLISCQHEMPAMYTWLKSREFGKSMVALTNKITENIEIFGQDCKPHESWSLLKICFTATKNFEPLIGVDYLNEILTILTSVLLRQPTGVDSSSGVVVFVCELSQSLLTSCLGCYQLTAVEDLLVCLFELSCSNKLLAEETQSRVRDTWCMGTEYLIKLQGGFLKDEGFLCKAAATIQNSFLKRSFQYNQLKDVSVIEDNALCLLRTISKQLQDSEIAFLDKSNLSRALLDAILPSDELKTELLNKLSSTVSNCRLHHLNIPLTQVFSPDDVKISPFILFVRCLVKILKEFVFETFDSGECKLEKCQLSEDSKEFLTDNLADMCLVMAYENGIYVHPQVENKEEIAGIFSEVSCIASRIRDCIDKENVLKILSKLIAPSKNENTLFVQVFSTLPALFGNNLESLNSWTDSNIKSLLSDSSSMPVNLQLVEHLIPCASAEGLQQLFVRVSSNFNEEGFLQFELSNQYLATLVSCLAHVNFENINLDDLLNVFKYIQYLKSKSDIRLLCDVQITDNNRPDVEFSISFAAFISSYLSKSKAVTDLWVLDLILCTLCGWINTLSKSSSVLLGSQEYVMFARNVFHLLSLVKNYVTSETAKEHSPDLFNEWKGLYFPTIFSLVFPMYFNLCEEGKKQNHKLWEIEQMFDSLSNSLTDLPSEDLLSCISDACTSDSNVFDLVDRLYALLISEIPAVQWSTHYLLTTFMEKVAEVSSKEAVKEEFDGSDDGSQRQPPLPVSKILSSSGQIVDTMLSDFHVEDCCLVKPFTDSYTYTLAYLLSWLHMLKIFGCSNSEIRSEYALSLQSSKLLDGLLLNLFRLVPNSPGINEKSSMFTDTFHPESASAPSSKLIQKVACQVYLNTLLQLPALVRHWWNKQDKRTADYVNKFTTTYVSSLISVEEIKSVQDTQVQFNNMTVKARPNAREVVAMYTMEDITIELVIRLPQNHPLGPVSIEAGQRIGVGWSQWRHWMLQLTTFLTHQNGSILDALSLWKRNVDKRFEGVEECMICFYVLHGATCQLPRLTCKTCKKKFHSACLYKWFSTSQNASCPLCRNLF